ncbi:LeuA family protein [Salinactinospora qingdaonensis]|uniref:3-hydroxy-3-methylglutaryl-CoA lyase n=1 Tax=Salinactinospora qingdaonensis TaxID=702744 RepID=A0ABP7GJD5_9ACTN
MTANPTPWHTDRWFTSPWNHAPDVAETFTFPDSVQVHDVTLRDGEQQAGVVFNADEKMRIAEGLAEAGVHRIEAGLPAVYESDAQAVRRIASAGLPSTVYAFSRCIVDDVKRALDCGVDGVVMEIPSSRHLIELGYRWSVDRAVDASIEATKFAHDNGLLVSFFPIDATRAAVEDYLNLVERVARDGHVDGLGLVDTFGVLTPHAVERFVHASKERLNVSLETHFHMDYGLGIANTLMAVAAGADVVQTTIAGIGERAGNTPMEEVVMALLTLYNRDIGIKTEKLTPLARMVGELSGVAQPANRAVTGTRLFDVESGIIASWVRNVRDTDRTEALPYLPELVGQSGPGIVLGKGSGLDNIVDALERLGLSATEEQRDTILQRVKQRSLETKRLLDDDEFTAIVNDVVAG